MNSRNPATAGDGTRELAQGGTPLVLGAADKTLDKPYSATRFLLPFRLNCAPSTPAGAQPLRPASPGALVYRTVEPTDWLGENQEVRRGYLTAETREVLFGRAKWWVMSGASEQLQMTTPDDRTVEATVCPPGIVLFEDIGGEDLLRCGFLVVEVRVGADWRLDDLLLFNELFRYWREPYAGQVKEFARQSAGFATLFAKLPQVSVKDVYTARWLAMLQVPLAGGRHLLADGAPDPEAIFGWYADHRAFVWTRALLAAEEFQRIVPQRQPRESVAEAGPASGFREMFGYWVKLLNTDKPGLDYANPIPTGYKNWNDTNATTGFERDWAGQHTYRRWEEDGCYYGFNSFCAAMLSREPPPYLPPTWRHWFQMYFDHVLLLLYVRVTLFGFSHKLTDISGKMLDPVTMARPTRAAVWHRDFRQLRLAFTCFENLYQFPLLSNQQQAIEMYTCARKSMDIDALYEEISKEISGSDELLEAEVEARRSELSEMLNQIAVVGFGVSCAFGMFQLPFIAGYFKGGAWYERGGWLDTVGAFVALSGIWSLFFWRVMPLLRWGMAWYSRIHDKRQ